MQEVEQLRSGCRGRTRNVSFTSRPDVAGEGSSSLVLSRRNTVQNKRELNEQERAERDALGWTFLHYFALKINYWSSRFCERQVSREIQAAAEWEIQRASAVMPNTSLDRTRDR